MLFVEMGIYILAVLLGGTFINRWLNTIRSRLHAVNAEFNLKNIFLVDSIEHDARKAALNKQLEEVDETLRREAQRAQRGQKQPQ